ncbi:MAG: hypothetical protein JXM70_09135 [Pirellulales bacterium]|nr:hypothetical protein [Pirellulales bacterium]
MKYFTSTILAFLALTGVALGSVVLDLVDEGTVDVGGGLILHKYIVTAEGAGITTLSKFTISSPVYQDSGPDTIWSQSGAVYLPPNDSHVIFGNVRMPDLKGSDAYMPGTPIDTVEEGPGGPGTVGLGTLNNYDSVNETWDAYVKTGINPDGSTPVLTHDLFQLLVEEGDEVELSLKISTHTGYEVEVVEYKDEYGYVIGTAYYAVGGTVDTYDLTLGTVYVEGDANKDGRVDLDDLSFLGANWGTTSGATWEMGNFDDDGDVDLDDLSLLGANWGYGTDAGAAIPEPSAIAMMIAGALCILGYRSRK